MTDADCQRLAEIREREARVLPELGLMAIARSDVQFLLSLVDDLTKLLHDRSEENGYNQGYREGYREGYGDGWSDAKTNATVQKRPELLRRGDLPS